MKYTLLPLFFLFNVGFIVAQTATELVDLATPTFDETSGLLYYNGKIITHNDGGGAASLYEINPLDGSLLRTVAILSATNVDWEDLAQDDNYIYIGDIGNNYGNRVDLKVYRISKADYLDGDDSATAEVINFSYANQVDFTSNLNNNNWDAEALISFGDKLLIFSKNWVNLETNVYEIPKTIGTHSATLVSNYNVDGLITGADISSNEDVIFLTGYTAPPSTLPPFMYTLSGLSTSTDVFSGVISAKIESIVGAGNQVEAICLYNISATNHQLYISNESNSVIIGPFTFDFPAKLWTIEIPSVDLTLDTHEVTLTDFSIFPNPFKNELNLSINVDEVLIYNLLGEIVYKGQHLQSLTTENLVNGVYIVHIKSRDAIAIKKIVKL